MPSAHNGRRNNICGGEEETMNTLTFLIFSCLSVFFAEAVAQEKAGQEADNIFFICHPADFTSEEILEDTQKLKCANITINNDATEDACGNFRMDLAGLTASGGFYVMETPGGDKAAKSFRLSRSTGDFFYSINTGLTKKTWEGKCFKHTEKFKF
jgi:hypothetical protein